MRRIVKPFDWIAALFCVPAFGLMLLAMINPRAYSAGVRNSEAPIPFMEWFLFIAGAILALIGIIWVLVTWGRSSNLTRIFGLIVASGPLLIVLLLIFLPLRMYSRGFARWAAREVRPVPIRAWIAAGTPSTATPRVGPPATASAPTALGFPYSANTPTPPGGLTEIPLTDCPVDISAVAPQQVWLTPDKRGLLLIWSDRFWGEGRGIFIGIDATSTPPADIPRWRLASPGVYVSDKIPLSY
jgi:hypothetical protein